MAKVGYARISTKHQTLDLQLDALKREGCEKIFSEVISTRLQVRHEFNKCIEYLRPGDTLVCYSLCRLARNHRELLELKDALDANKVSLYSIQGNIDTSNSQGMLYFHIYSSILEYERNWIRDRVMDGLVAARARGRLGGRKRVLTGKQAKVLYDMYKTMKYSGQEIADHFGIKKPTVWKYIREFKAKDRERSGDESKDVSCA